MRRGSDHRQRWEVVDHRARQIIEHEAERVLFLVASVVAIVLLVGTAMTAYQVRLRFAPVAVGGGDNPLAAARLPGGVTTIPNPSWADAGVDNGIPAGTVCQTLGTAGQVRGFAQSVTVAQIETALAACDNDPEGDQQVVVLETGTYTMTAGITFPGNYVTLRGEGPDNTLLIFENDDSCSGSFAPICMTGSGLGYYVGEGTAPPNIVNWTGTNGADGVYTQGATTITLSGTPNLSVGEIIFLDQLPETTDPGSSLWIWNCVAIYTGGSPPGCTEQGGGGSVLSRNCNVATTCRAQHQMVKIVSCTPACTSSTSSPHEVVIDKPVYMPNWRTGQDPEAFWGNGDYREYQGLEDLSVDNLSGAVTAHAIVSMMYVANSWVKHVRLLYGPSSEKAWIRLFGAGRVTIQDSYMYGTTDDSGASTHYGIESYGGCDTLVQNNIMERRTSPLVRDGECGAVYAYNFYRDDYYDALGGTCCNDGWMQAGNYSHAAGNNMILDEGNIGVGAKHDIVHGTSNLFTYLRNRFDGRDVAYKDTETNPVMLHPYQRGMAFLCNVLGTTGYHASYETTGSVTTIWRFRSWGSIPADSLVTSTLLRWGNWDTFTSANDTSDNDTTGIKWDTAEVPDGISYLPNADPASQSCPSSLYLSAKPSWWGTVSPWPPIGPDVTGSQTGTNGITGVGGHAYENPAKVCYDTLADDTAYAADGAGTRPKRFGCEFPL